MKILFVYYSESGNTKLIAEEMAEVLSSMHQVQVSSVLDFSDDVEDYDLLFVGAACHSATIAKPALDFLDGLPSNPDFNLAGFYTHSTLLQDGTEYNDTMFDRWAGRCDIEFNKICDRKNIELKGIFHCQGKATPDIEAFIHTKVIPEEEKWVPYRDDLRTHPDEEDLASARDFALAIANED